MWIGFGIHAPESSVTEIYNPPRHTTFPKCPFANFSLVCSVFFPLKLSHRLACVGLKNLWIMADSTMHPSEPFSIPDTRSFANLGGVNMPIFGLLLMSSMFLLSWTSKNDTLSWKTRKSGFFAVKILTAYATKAQSRVVEELGILQHITQQARTSDHPGRSHVVTLQESFELESAHGRHLCLVQQALGTFPALFQHGKKLPLPLVKHVSRQLLEALDFLHSQCRVIHTGETFQRFGSSFWLQKRHQTW